MTKTPKGLYSTPDGPQPIDAGALVGWKNSATPKTAPKKYKPGGTVRPLIKRGGKK